MTTARMASRLRERAIANGNLHLTIEELLAQQERDLAIMLEEEREAAREKAAQATFEAERQGGRGGGGAAGQRGLLQAGGPVRPEQGPPQRPR